MMKTNPASRIASIVIGAAGLVMGLCVAGVWGLSEWRLRRGYEAPLVPLRPTEPLDLDEGKRMARLVGCWDGCHGSLGEGGEMELRGIVRHTAPTLSQVLSDYSDEELARLVRYGVKRDGRSAVGMIAYTFWALGDQDLANIIAHLRRQPGLPPIERRLELTWGGRLALATGDWKVSAAQVDRARPRWGDSVQATPMERGRYLASVTCSECHGLDYDGNALERAPSLAILGGYSLAQFTRLIRTATPIGDRTLDQAMTWVVDAPFTDEEVVGLYRFLRTHHGFEP